MKRRLSLPREIAKIARPTYSLKIRKNAYAMGRFALPHEFELATLHDAQMKGRFAVSCEFVLGALLEKPPTNIAEKGVTVAPYPEFVLAYLRNALFS